MTLWRDGEEMENRKTGKSMEAVARLEATVDGDWRRWWTVVRLAAMVDGGVMELGLGRGSLLMCSTMEEKKKEYNGLCWLIAAVLDSFPIFIFFYFYLFLI